MRTSCNGAVTLTVLGWFVFLGFIQPETVSGQASSNGVLREVYLGIGGNAISDLLNHPSFPNSPSLETIQPDFEAPVNVAESYGQRMRALLLPPMDGDYSFWVASDDQGVLYLSTTEDPAQKVQIATVNGWTSSREWTKEPNQHSGLIPLQAGQRYYIEALEKEGGGGDNLAVRWQLPNGQIEEPIPNQRLLVFGLGPPVISQQPANVTVVEGESATFSVQLQRMLGATFQWQRNGTAIPGATNASYTIGPLSLADSGSSFRATATNAYGFVTSRDATLTVLPDTTRPALSAVGNLGEDQIVFVVFSEPVEPASATQATNYVISGGVTVWRAVFGTDARTIILTTTPLTPDLTYTLSVSGVRDRATTPNTILANSQRAFSLSLPPLDVGYLSLSKEPLGPANRRHGVVISEVMYHPLDVGDALNREFIEIYNSQPWFEEMGGWRISGSVDYVFPEGTTIASGGFLVAAAAPSDVEAAYGIPNVLGPFVDLENLPNDSGTLRLRNRSGAVLFEMNYGDNAPFPIAADGAGPSLVLARPSYGERDARAWAASEAIGGTPGRGETAGNNSWRTIVINEFLAHTDLPEVDFIELFNYGNSAVNLGGCILTDDPATNKFTLPANTILTGRGILALTETDLGFALSAAGERIFLKAPKGLRVIDAVRFGGQENGVSTGRTPDGAPDFSPLASPTPGSRNARVKPASVVINEIMFDPISGDANDEYIELRNAGAEPVDLSGWRIRDGVSFNVPGGTVLPASGYLVIANNAEQLRAHYPGLTAVNCLGNFSGRLANDGERLELNKPDQIVGTNALGQTVTDTIHILVDEVTYGSGGRWGRWAGGGGSSLELRDARADRRLASNWANSDESTRSDWVTVEATGTMDNGWADAYQLHVTLEGAGEVLLDEVEVIPAGGANLIANGTFETGTDGWVFQGNHNQTGWESGEGFHSSGSLHLRATGRGDTGSNRVRTQLPYTLTSGTTVTLRAKARWLKGNPNLLLRLRGNWMEAFGSALSLDHFGTPGAPNSTAAANVGPAITTVSHHPTLPAAGQSVLVTARVDDPDGLAFLALNYRIDPSTNYLTLAMTNNGAGWFSAVLPGQAGGVTAAFFLQASDNGSPPATSTFPNDAPDRECVVRWGDTALPGTLGTYRFWITKTNVDRWSAEEKMSNNPKDLTFIYGTNRIVYNAGGFFHGSPYHSPAYNSPVGNGCDYDLNFPADDRLLGETDINLFRPGNGGGDSTAQREIHGYWFAGQFGIPYLYHRPVFLYVNGQRRETVFHDAQQPNGDYVDQWFPDDAGGELHKVKLGFEFGDQAYGNGESGYAVVGANLAKYTTSGGQKKLARYRQTWPLRSVPVPRQNDYTNLFALVDAVNTTASLGSESYSVTLSGATDVEEWFKVHVTQHLYNNFDSFSYGGGQNAFAYKPEHDAWKLLLWDVDFAFGGSPTDGNLTGIGGADHGPRNTHPPFARLYWQALIEAANGMLTAARSNPMLDARYQGMTAAGAAVGSPQGIKDFIAARRDLILTQIQANQSPFVILSNGGADFATNRNLISLTGTAPLEVRTILVNGISYPVTWTALNTWVLRVPLGAGANTLLLSGVDPQGNPVNGASGTLHVNYTGTEEQPQDKIVINEIMYHPVMAGAEYVELYNTSATHAFDLSGWRLNGVGFTFENGTVFEPDRYLVVARDRAAFAAAYGASIPVAGEFRGSLDNGGETLTLIQTGIPSGQEVTIDQVTYGDDPPWPGAADGAGPSLQLIDPGQDNNRSANWGVIQPDVTNFLETTYDVLSLYTPGGPNSVGQALNPFPALWLNEILPNNSFLSGNGRTDSFGDSDPWVELYNGSSADLNISGYFLADNYTNLTQWAFPTGTVIGPGQFLLVWLDGELQESSPAELHAGFRAAPAVGSVVLSRGQSLDKVVDYLNYSVPVMGRSYGSFPDGAVSGRRLLAIPTPAAPNNPAYPSIDVRINEWMADNVSTLADPLDGQYDDWFELYNPADETADLSGYFLSDTLSTPEEWEIPEGTVVPAYGHLLVWADGNPAQNRPDLPDRHAGFSLSKNGETIALFAPDGTLIDTVNFGPQIADVSEGRFPDGYASVYAMTNATPRTANVLETDNTPPKLARIGDQAVDEGAQLRFTAEATDDDVPTQTLTFTLEGGAPPGAGIDPNSGEFTWTPGEEDGPGIHAVTIRVTDNGQPPFSDTETILITVNEVNTAPVLSPLNSVSLDEGSLLLVTNTAVDPDGASQELIYSLGPEAPPGMTIDPALGVIRWIPSEEQGPGNYSLTVWVTDQGDPPLSHFQAFTVTVREINTPPKLVFAPEQTILAGQVLTFQAGVVDLDLPQQSITFGLGPDAAPGAEIDPASGQFRWMPTQTDAGTNLMTLIAIDDGPGPAQGMRTLTVVVLPAPNPSIAREGNVIAIRFPTLPGRTYRVEYKDHLSDADWIPLEAGQTLNGPTITVEDPMVPGGQRFYRVAQLD
jgi:Lamin Tail Domain/CotH kinase protein/Putative Ig domain